MTPETLDARAAAARPVPPVEIVGLGHVYGATTALADVTLAFAAGTATALIGPDGVGKSTLLGLITGVRRLVTGEIRVFGGSMRERGVRDRVAHRIAYMPQGLGRNLYPTLSVAENVAFHARLFGAGEAEIVERSARLLAATGLAPFADRPAGKLSGGMKQKLSLCCALVHDPDLLVLDEPTTGVDPLSRRRFWDLIAGIRRDRPEMTVIVATAYMEEAAAFERVVAIDDGRVIADGSPAEICAATATHDLEAAFVALQAGAAGGPVEPFTIEPRPAGEGPIAIEAEGLTRRFGDFIAVDHVSFAIPRGEIFGFLGSNGCGKTTTMKMLTGLLGPTEGEAMIYGRPVDAGDLSIRRRVGFMTQSFSLYGELTVRQNLVLHARLFHLSEPEVARRIEALMAEVGLTDHADTDAASLPLGVRQRLSLAVAIVHGPELLILDEPTSGVDPQARDDFWRLLVDLSRKQGVTIFVSTHFMNEAMRCDRISLMDAGRVLACDTPAEIIASKDASDLEAAFIAYIEGAGTAQPVSPGSEGEPLVRHEGDEAPTRPSLMPLRRLFAYAQCETRTLLRDPIRLAFAFLGSFLLLLIFGYGVSGDVTNIRYAAFDHDNSPESRAYLSGFSSSRYFTQGPPIRSVAEMDMRLRSDDITLAIEIPPDFGRMVKRGAGREVSAWIDGANTFRAATIEGYVQQAHAFFAERRQIEARSPSAGGPVTTILLRNRYNPTAESIYSMGPSVPAMLLMLFLAILTAISVAREKEIGTIANFYATPTGKLEFLIGKQLPYIGVGLANFAVMTATVVFLFGVPLKGSGTALAFGALLYVSAATGYGLFISTFTKSQVAAVFAGAILSMLPTMQFSGMLQPVSTLSGGARLMGDIWPTTYYMHMSVGAFTKGLGFADMRMDIAVLALFTPVFLALSALLLKKQES